MKKIVLSLFGVSAVIIFALTIRLSVAQSDTKPAQTTEPAVTPLPTSLGNFYPPSVDQPVYLFRMLEMADPFAGIVVDLFEDDHENLDANFETFRARYIEVSNLVPEWKEYYPMEPIDNLKKAISTRDKDQIMAAFEEVDRACQQCHYPYMTRVHYAHRWSRFQEIKMTDPLTEGEISFQQLMQSLEVNFTGIGLDVKQGQVENARGQLQAFRARFELLREACTDCHDTERTYFVDEGVTGIFDKLDQALGSSPLDPQMVGRLVQEIGSESCLKCHLVHGPAGLAQLQMAK